MSCTTSADYRTPGALVSSSVNGDSESTYLKRGCEASTPAGPQRRGSAAVPPTAQLGAPRPAVLTAPAAGLRAFQGSERAPLPVLLKRIDAMRNLSLEQGQTAVHPHSGIPLSKLKERAVDTTWMNLKINAPTQRGCAKKDTRVLPCTSKSGKRTLTCSDNADTFGAGGEVHYLDRGDGFRVYIQPSRQH